MDTIADVLRSIRDDCLKCTGGAVSVHGSTSRLLSMIGKSRDWIDDFIVDSFDNVEELVSKKSPKNTIPKLYHKIWLTDPIKPSLPSHDYLEKLVFSTGSMESDWTLIFWSNSQVVREFVQGVLKGSLISVVVADFDETFRRDQLYSIISSLLMDKKFVLAGDASKVAILNRFGGIYSDLGLQVSQPILGLLSYADYAFFFGHAVFLQTSLLAAPPNSRMLTIFSNIMTRPESLPRELIVLGSEMTATDEVRAFSGACATICLLLFSDRNQVNLLLPDRSKFHTWEAKGSWYNADVNSGNILISESNPTFLSEALYKEAEGQVTSHASVKRIDAVRAHILELSEFKNPRAIKGPRSHLDRRIRGMFEPQK